MTAATREFRFEGHRLVYDDYGDGERVVLLLPALLFARTMHRPLAEELAARGHRVLCLDLLGHGGSDRPPEMGSYYSMTAFGRQALALLDAAPERVKGLLIEMPVLDNALLACAIGFTPLLVGLTFGAPVARLVGRAARTVPRGAGLLGDLLLDSMSQDPKPSASVLQGLFSGRVAPSAEDRRQMRHPALVIGHHRDPIHPFSDSDMLVHELPNARLIQASSNLELRLTPERLTNEIVGFIEECFGPAETSGRRRREAVASGRRSAPARGPS